MAAAKAAARVPVSGRHVLRRAMRSLVSKLVDAVEAKFDTIRTDLEAKAAAEAAAAAAAAGEGEEGEGEGPALEAEASKAAKGKAAEAKAGKGQAKGGKAAAAEPEAVAPGSGLPSVVHLQPAFHEKAATAAKAVVKVGEGLGREWPGSTTGSPKGDCRMCLRTRWRRRQRLHD